MAGKGEAVAVEGEAIAVEGEGVRTTYLECDQGLGDGIENPTSWPG